MRRISLLLLAVLSLIGFVTMRGKSTTAKEGTPAASAVHPFVGTWVVDTIVASQTDSPEIAIVTPDGRLAGLGANRVAGGSWEAIDAQTAMLTLVTVSDKGGVGGYVVVRGPHVVDATGERWTCQCTFTVVAADGTVLDSGLAPASGRRLPVQGPEAMGTALAEVPTWTPSMPTATPTA